MDNKHKLLIKRESEKAIIPTRATEGSAGYDLYSTVDTIVPKRGKQLISTGICVGLPNGVYGRIAPRSGLAWKSQINPLL